MATVEVRPLPLKKWHKKEGRESFAQPKVIEALISAETGRYATGLTQEETEKYSKELGLDLSDNWIPDTSHPFWGTKAGSVPLQNSTMIFHTDRPMDFIKVKLMKASKFVANSMAEWEKGAFPDATHVIFDEEEDVNSKAAKVALKRRCSEIALKMSNEDKVAMVQVLSKKSIRGKSQSFIEVEFDEAIERDPEEFLRVATLGRGTVSLMAIIAEAVYKGILTKDAMGVYYMGEAIGTDELDAVKYISDVKNDRIKALILDKLNK